MRDVSRRLLAVVFTFLFLLPVAAYFGGTPALAAGKRVIVTPNADYAGFDMSTVKNVDLDACQAACLGDNACRAFTFNTKAGWCFLKSDFGAARRHARCGRRPRGRGRRPDARRSSASAWPNSTSCRRATSTRRARWSAPSRTASPPSAPATMRCALPAPSPCATADFDDAAVAFGRALAIANDEAIAWLDFSARQPRAQAGELGRAPAGGERRQRRRDRRLSPLRHARRPRHRARARRRRASPSARRGSPRSAPTAPAWRSPTWRSVRDAYEKLVAEHGFRIVSHEVEADSADAADLRPSSPTSSPCRGPDLADFVTVEGGDGLAVEPQDSQICIDGVKHGSRYIIRVRAGLPAADGETLAAPVELNVYVRDRAPWVGFAGNAYVLPAGPGA